MTWHGQLPHTSMGRPLQTDTSIWLLDLLSRLRAKAEQRFGLPVGTMVAGLGGFSIHRLLLANWIESHVVDAGSIAVDRGHRRVKADAIDGETLLRTLMAWARGERRVCSIVRAEPGRRRPPALDAGARYATQERIQRTNRIRACSGV